MWFYLVILLYVCTAMRVIPHSNHGMMSMESVVRPEDTWMIEVRNIKMNMDDDVEVDHFLSELKPHLSNDGCMLHISKNSRTLIMLIIHCPSISIQQKEAEVQSLGLVDTEAYVNHVFTGSDVYLYKNDVRSLLSKSLLSEQIQRNSEAEVRETSLAYETTATNVQEQVVWNLERISTRLLSEGSDEYVYNADGEGVDVYILDTGILASHEEFDGNRATFLHNAIPDGIATDCNGHGTHVAGIVGSRTYGVAKKVRLYGVRVLNCSGDGSIDDILEGADVIIERASSQPAERRGVINLSLGGAKSDVIDRMVKSLREAGLVVVIAAGNSGQDACQFSPSSMGANNYVLTVGASDRNDHRTSWSNYGSCVTITAPGKDITSTWFSTPTAIATISGTSMAAPAVTGVAALVLQQLLAVGIKEHDKPLLVDRVTQLIIGSATPNIVTDATLVGGGKSLLYSVVNVGPPAIVDVDRPVQAIPVPRQPLSNDAMKVGSPSSIILCIAFTILWFSCIL